MNSFDEAFDALAENRETHRKAARLLRAHAAKRDYFEPIGCASPMMELVIGCYLESLDADDNQPTGGDIYEGLRRVENCLRLQVLARCQWEPGISQVWFDEAERLAAES